MARAGASRHAVADDLSQVIEHFVIGQRPHTWATWTGDFNISANQFFDAANSAPVQDWHLASLLASMFNTNNFTLLFRVNDPNPNDWQGLLNGLTALTNGNAEIDPF